MARGHESQPNVHMVADGSAEGPISAPGPRRSVQPAGPAGVLLTRSEGAGFGFRLAIVHDPIECGGRGAIISHVSRGCSADLAGLECGDQIIRLNGADVREATCAEIANLVAASGSTMLLHTVSNGRLLSLFEEERDMALGRGGALPLPAGGASGSVTLARGSNGTFGLTLRDNKRRGTIHVNRVVPGGAAWHDGRVQDGMEVTELNGIDLEGYTAAALSELLLETSPDSLTLGLAIDGMRTITLDAASNGSFGIVLGGPMDSAAVRRGVRGVFACGTMPNTPAAASQLKGELILGHQILQISGLSTTSMTLSDVLLLLNRKQSAGAQTISLGMAPNVELLDTYTDLPSVTLPRGRHGYSLTLVGPKTAAEVERRRPGVLVFSHTPLSEGSAVIERGTQIVSVNGQDTSDLTVQHVKGLLQFHTDSVTLGLRNNTRARREYIGENEDTPLTLEVGTDSSSCVIVREKGSFGVQFNGARSTDDLSVYGIGLFVAGVKPGSPAARAEGLEVGWQLMSLNGIDMSNASFDDLETTLKKVGDTLSLRLEPNEALLQLQKKLVVDIPDAMSRRNVRSSIVGRPMSAGTSSSFEPTSQLDVTVQLEKPSDGGYGLMFGGPHDEKEANVKGRGVFISGVRGNSVAAANTQIQLGMQIVAMNDVDLTQATFVELRELLQSVGDKMTLVLRENLELIKPYRKADYRGKAMRSTVKKKKVTVDVKLTKVPGGGFGLKFGGPRSTAEADESGYGIFISGTTPGSVADQCADIRVGWQIMTMNGEDMLDATFTEMKDALQRIESTMELRLVENETLRSVYTKKKNAAMRSTIRKSRTNSDTSEPGDVVSSRQTSGEDSSPPEPSEKFSNELPPERVHFSLQKGADGYGLQFGGPKTHQEAEESGFGVFISGVKPDSAASRCPDVRIGWQILSINGEFLEESTFEELKQIIASLGDSMDLVLCKNEALREKYARNPKPQRRNNEQPPKAASVGAHSTDTSAESVKADGALPLDTSQTSAGAQKDIQSTTESTPSLSSPETELVTCTLTRNETGFGVKFGGPKTEADAQAKGHGIFISGVKTGSVAEECVEQLRVGWQIIAFNGQDTTKATFVEMKALLASVGNTMELVLQKNDALKAAYSKKKKSKSETQD